MLLSLCKDRIKITVRKGVHFVFTDSVTKSVSGAQMLLNLGFAYFINYLVMVREKEKFISPGCIIGSKNPGLSNTKIHKN